MEYFWVDYYVPNKMLKGFFHISEEHLVDLHSGGHIFWSFHGDEELAWNLSKYVVLTLMAYYTNSIVGHLTLTLKCIKTSKMYFLIQYQPDFRGPRPAIRGWDMI